MLKYIVAGVIVVLTWALAILLQFSYYLELASLVTLLVALVLLLLFGLEKLRERRSARELERALAAQAAQQAASARPDLQHELAEMNAEFQKAITALKTTKKGGKKALYALPWYAIIGPPGCGKSTALRNSGLEFPYLSASGGGVRGLGGTRNCDWWMTGQGVILDTAGRWTSEDEDRDEWLAFLDLLKRYRPKKPLNGIIAAISVGELGGTREEQTIELARRVRARIDEVQGRLSMSLPVYVLFTKCDLIPGFIETFGSMSREERSQIWGFTAPLSKPIGPPGEYFARGFDELLSALERRALKRMGEERRVASREMIFAFPQQLAIIRENLKEFVHHLFQENAYNETPRFRGVYFTSGTQEGRPIDRLMSRMAEAFGQTAQVQLPAPQVEAKSYFLRDMFARIVFEDAEVAVRSPEEVRRQRRTTYVLAALIFLLALGISGLPAISWASNRSFLEETRAIFDRAHQATAGDSVEPIAPAAIEELRARAMLLEEYHSWTPLLMSMGMYQDRVYEPFRDAYLATVRRRVIAPIIQADAAEMESFGQRFESGARPDAQEMRAMYERLKLHLLLTAPRDENTLEPEQLDDDLERFVRSALVHRWQTATQTRRADAAYTQIARNVEYYVGNLRRRPELAFPRNPAAVARVRGVFNAIGGFDMAVEGIIEEVRPRGADVTIARLLGRDVTMLTSRERVRFAFTRDAWDRYVRDMLETDAARFFGEPWVLGHPPPEDERRAEQERFCQLEALKSYYLNRYVQEWRRFIDAIEVTTPHTDEEALALLTQLTTTGHPMRYTMLVRQIDREVTLDAAGAGGRRNAATDAARREAERAAIQRLGKRLGGTHARRLMESGQADLQRRLSHSCPPIPNALTPAQVRERFIGFLELAPPPPRDLPEGQAEPITPARRYEEQLEYLRDALHWRLAGTNATSYEQRRAAARALTEQIISERPAEWQPRFQTLLRPPVEGAVPLPPAPPGAAPAATAPGSAAPGSSAPGARSRR